MPEPIIPSGRDYDAGLVPGDRTGEKRGLLGRIASKIRKGRGSKVHNFDLRLDPRVGAGQAPPRRPESSTLKDGMPSDQPEPAKLDQPGHAEPLPTRRTKPSRPKPQSARVSARKTKSSTTKPDAPTSLESLLEAHGLGGQLGLGTWLLIANPDECNAAAVEYLDHVVSTCGDTTLASVVRWRLSAAAGDGTAASRSLTLEAAGAPGLPTAIAEVLRFLAANPMSLAKYRGDLGLADGKEAALTRLRMFCRGYPSAEPILRALEIGDAAAARRALKYNSAAWQAGMSIINAAIAAVDGVTSTDEFPICRIPLDWLTGSPVQRCLAAALSSIVADDERGRVRRNLESDLTAAIVSMSDEDRAQAAVWLSARGVHVDMSQRPKRRQLRTPVPLTVAQQPPSTPQPRKAADMRARCRRCGVGEPMREGGICSSCAHAGD